TANPQDHDRIRPSHPLNAAYTIYTSGTTGTPKGVVVTHTNVTRLLGATDAWFGFGPDDVWTLFHSYAFDFSVWELWGALLTGGRLVVVPHEIRRSPRLLLDLIAAEGVTVLNQTPSAFYQLAEADRENPRPLAGGRLRRVIFGGEVLDPARLGDWYARHAADAPQMVNMYGITETTVHVTLRPLDPKDTADPGRSPIGRAIPDLRLYVLDEGLRPVAPGVPGELYVAGAGLSRGYLHRPALSAERFLPDPFGPPGTRMYRTGDLARWTADGELEYLGRADTQVQVRGFRVELGEIESVLARHPAVAQAAATALPDPSGTHRLVAYAVPAAPEAVPPAAEIRAHLAAELPDHMVPATVDFLARLPLTAAGKLDRAALPEPRRTAERGSPPRTQREEALCQLFAAVLDVPGVTIDDNFFERGGHSLLVFPLIGRIESVLGGTLTVEDVFTAPTVRALAPRLAGTAGRGRPEPVIRLGTGTTGRPLFCVHPITGLAWSYTALLPHLGPGTPVYGLQATDERHATLDDLAAAYTARITAIQPHGPYRLVGWSLGGSIAQAIAVALRERGEDVTLLALIDAYPFLGRSGPGDGPPGAAESATLTALRASLDRSSAPATATPPDRATVTGLVRASLGLPPERADRLIDAAAHILGLAAAHTPAPYAGPTVLFTAAGQPEHGATAAAWKAYLDGPLRIHPVPGEHEDLLRAPAVAEIGRVLAMELDGEHLR
ncbi:non-ribosomal peptide synthetase, partial [Streptomyces litchfieldiae]